MDADKDKVTLAIKAAASKHGYKKLQPQQELAVESFVDCNNVSLPTGSGESCAFGYCLEYLTSLEIL